MQKKESENKKILPFDKAMIRIDRIMSIFEDAVGFTCFTAMLLIVLYNVVLRYWLKLPNKWGEEAARYLFIILSFAACSLCVRESAHLGVTVIHDRFSGRVQRILELLVDVICFVTYIALAFIMSAYVKTAVKSGQVTPSLRIPFYYLYIALEVCFILCVVRSIMIIWNKYISKTHPLDNDYEEVMM